MTTLTWPSVKVEVAFTTDPNTATTPTWTDISHRVLNIAYARSGRSDELAYYQSGTATLTLDNHDGMFNVDNSSSPYFGNLRVYRPIRITATWAGISYPLWQGFVERWPQTWVNAAQGTAPIECVDALALLAQIDLDATLASEILPNVVAYYPLTEGSGATSAGNQSANGYAPGIIVHTKTANLTTPGSYQFGGQLDVAGADAQAGLQFTGTNAATATPEDGYGLLIQQIPIDWADGWAADIWVQIPPTPTQNATIWRVVDPSNPTSTLGSASLRVLSSGVLEVVWNFPDGVSQTLTTAAKVNTGSVYYIDVACGLSAGSGLVTLNVWGANLLSVESQTASISTVGGNVISSTAMIGAALKNSQVIPRANPVVDGEPLTGTVGHFAVYSQFTGLPNSTIIAQAGFTAFAGETTDQRTIRLLRYGAWQTGYQTAGTGRSTMSGATSLNTTQLLSDLQQITDAELGTLTVTNDGKVDFLGRADRIGKKTATVIFGAGGLPYLLDSSFKVDYDPTYVYNDVQLSRPQGASGIAVDGTSIQRYFPRQLTKTLNVDTDDQTQQAADFLLNRYKEPQVRLEAITVDAGAINPSDIPTAWPKLLALDLHQRVTLNHQPLGSGNVSMDGFVEQLGMTIDPNQPTWKVTFALSPVLQDYAFWDDTAGRSTWDNAVWSF